MFALPHHLRSFETATAARLVSSIRLQSPTKGVMTAVLADQWRMREVGIPSTIGWLPVGTGGSAIWSAANLNRLSAVAKYELTQDFANVTNLDSMYFAGKSMAKYAYMCLTMSEILKDVPLTRQCQIKLKVKHTRKTSVSLADAPQGGVRSFRKQHPDQQAGVRYSVEGCAYRRHLQDPRSPGRVRCRDVQ